jgi:hypothetical protein
MTALINWSSSTWGQPGSNVHIGSSDDLGKHGAHSDEADL